MNEYIAALEELNKALKELNIQAAKTNEAVEAACKAILESTKTV